MSLSQPASALHCVDCNIDVPSESDMHRHLNGRKHQSLIKFKKMQQSQADRSAFVCGFPFGTTEIQLKKMFSVHGTILNVVVNKERGLFAIIEFDEKSSAQNAILSSGKIIIGNRYLTVKPRLIKETQTVENVNKLKVNHCGQELCVSKSVEKNSKGVSDLLKITSYNSKQAQLLDREEEDLVTCLKTCKSVDEQIDVLVRNLQLTEEDYAQREGICQEIMRLFNTARTERIADCVVRLFGSSANMLGVRGCDIDLFLDLGESAICDSGSDHCSESRDYNVKRVAKRLRQGGNRLYVDIFAVASARCPVVKFTHVPTNIRCDISLNNRLALRNTELIRCLVSCDERVRPLVYVVRRWGKVMGVSGSGGGKLTNYSITLLVIFYLMNTKPPVLPSIEELSSLSEEKHEINGWDCSFSSDSLTLQSLCSLLNNCSSHVELLSGFFQFMAEFNFRANVVCTRSGQAVDLQTFSTIANDDTKLIKFKISTICIQDPFVLDHNTSYNVNDKQAGHIIHQFQLAATRCRHLSFNTFTNIECRQGNHDITSPEYGLVYLLSPALPTHDQSSHGSAAKKSQIVPSIHTLSVTFSISKLAVNSVCSKAGDINAVKKAWCHYVVDITRKALFELLDITIINRQMPSDLLPQSACHTQHDATSDDRCLISGRDVDGQRVSFKRLLSSDGATCNVDTDFKRHKANEEEVLSDVCRISVHHSTQNEHQSTPITDCPTELSSTLCVNIPDSSSIIEATKIPMSADINYLLCADCTTSCRLWVGRKKISQQFRHVTHEYEREVLVTKALKSQLPQVSAQLPPVLDFEICAFNHPTDAMDTITIAMRPTRKTMSEFSCFVTFFKSLLIRLVDRCVTGVGLSHT